MKRRIREFFSWTIDPKLLCLCLSLCYNRTDSFIFFKLLISTLCLKNTFTTKKNHLMVLKKREKKCVCKNQYLIIYKRKNSTKNYLLAKFSADLMKMPVRSSV